ncbi:uncharacterized protein FIBRA_02490 [Fibroporia radiculosa]|uniref:Mitochondrial distribution and morphology protein 35 n=1 Tax=Fibroporia radiculosa TaxID=599839 RepID=J4HV11_9APHY|nr:uncharacterized protein FIBRA_02490 [Fibroporia radiculosa]CCM00457.1 predicted protein [Fibroporia radiculosa]
MAHSLAEECTPLKREYDACFNAWFEGYLEPAVSAAAKQEERSKFSQEKAAEYERSCGKIWTSYPHAGIKKAVKDRGLDSLLEQAREENPLKDPPPPPAVDGLSS